MAHAKALGAPTFLSALLPLTAVWAERSFTLLGQPIHWRFGALQVTAVVTILLFSMINCLAVRLGGRLQTALTVLKLAGIAVLVVGVFAGSKPASWANLSTPPGVHAWSGLAAFGTAMLAALWAYDGWSNMPMAAGEVRDPGRSIPRALIAGMVLVILVYCAANAAYFYALPIEEVATSSSTRHRDALPVATKAAQTFLGEQGGRLVSVAFLLSALGALNGAILTNARVPFAMARDGVFFARLGGLSAGSHVPVSSVAAQAAWSCALALSGTFDQLTDYVIFGSWIFYGLVASSVFVLRRKMPGAERPYRTGLPRGAGRVRGRRALARRQHAAATAGRVGGGAGADRHGPAAPSVLPAASSWRSAGGDEVSAPRSIGSLAILRRYPVKSMKGEDLARAFVSAAGVKGDRAYPFADPRRKGVFPWLTARQVREMILFEPRFLGETPDEPTNGRYRVEVTTPEGARHDLEDPAFLEALQARWNQPFELRFSGSGFPDVGPVSILGLSAIRRLEQGTGIPLDHRRFRANFYVEWDDPALLEDELVGRPLRFGDEVEVVVDRKDLRCVIVNLDPLTSESAQQILTTVAQRHAGCLGVYGVTVREGVAAVGAIPCSSSTDASNAPGRS